MGQALCLSAALLLSAGIFIASSTPHPLRIERETIISLDGSTATRAVPVQSSASGVVRASALRLFPAAPITMSEVSRDSEAAEIAARTPKALALPRT